MSFAKNSVVGKRAGAKAAVSRKYNCLIREAEAKGKTRTAAAYKAHKTMKLRAIETA